MQISVCRDCNTGVPYDLIRLHKRAECDLAETCRLFMEEDGRSKRPDYRPAKSIEKAPQ